jgi:hypothetical protein
MTLREHPLMTYRNVPNWPPVWTQQRKGSVKTLKGEIGVLKYVYASSTVPVNKCYLVIEHEKETYIGALQFDDQSFCDQVSKLLKGQIGRSIQQVGDFEMSL